MKRRRRILLVSALCVLLGFLAAAGTLFAVRGDWRYLAALRFRRYPAAMLTAQQPEALTPVPLADFLQDSRVTVTSDLLLINGDHGIPEGFSPVLEGEGGIPMSPAALSAFRQMNRAAETETGTRLYVRSAWRSAEEQRQEWLAGGEKIAAQPGYSEHETGLALDVCVAGYGGMSFLKTKAGRYVNDFCGEFGFVVRYPYGGQAETGVDYEPWHVRYVGLPHSSIIMNSGITLEGYMNLLEPETWYQSGAYYILRTAGQSLAVPQQFEACTASQDNLGYWVLTFRMD